MNTRLPSRRTLRKLGRDLLVVGVPAAAIWIIGHPADLEQFGLSGPDALRVVGYATGVLAIYRWYRDFRGTGPTV